MQVINAPSLVPPRIPTDPLHRTALSGLIYLLLNATTDWTDTDGDGLPDSVERVIGTDLNNTDSDFDSLNDTFEGMNDLDPLEPDSNMDGLPDYYEVTGVVSMDIDNDGTPNAWDADNDGDGVPDVVDLSPCASTNLTDVVSLELRTGGEMTYATFQLVPENPEHLKLYGQYWDWPHDEEAMMKDLDDSEEDLQVIPMLNLSVDVALNQSDLVDQGVIATPGGVLVPLYPVWDLGTIVAMAGRLSYPGSVDPDVFMNASLIWRILGSSDERAVALRAESGLYVTVGEDGYAVASGDQVNVSETFRWVEAGNEEISLMAHNGFFLAPSPGAMMVANQTFPGGNASLEFSEIPGGVSIRIAGGDYLAVSPEGFLMANATGEEDASLFHTVDMGYLSEQMIMVTYEEDFVLTGLRLEENHGSDVSLFFDGDVNRTLATNFVLAYEFLRNSTSTVYDMGHVLGNYGVAVNSSMATFSSRDEAMASLAGEMLPEALGSLPNGSVLPVIAAIEDRSCMLDLLDLSPGSHVASSSLTADLAALPLAITKTMKTDWYNTSDMSALAMHEVADRIIDLGMGENATMDLICLMTAWNTGEQTLARLGSIETTFDVSDIAFLPQLVEDMINFGMEGVALLHETIGSIEDVLHVYRFIQAAKFLRSLKAAGWSVSIKGTRNVIRVLRTSYKQISQSSSKFWKTWERIGKVLEVLAVLMELGFAIYELMTIAYGSDLSPQETYMALQLTLMNLIYAMALIMIGTIPFVGWLISLAIALSDLFGNWVQDLFGWFVDLFTDVTNQVTPDIQMVGDPSLEVDDEDGNGIDVGDRVEFRTQMKANMTCTDWGLLRKSDLYPYVKLAGPAGSNSATGYTFPERNVNWEMLPLPPTSTWRRFSSSGGHTKWKGQTYEVGAWIEPGIGMPNFPVEVELMTYYELWYEWRYFVFLVFYWFWQYHDDWVEGTETLGSFTIPIDVMPGTIEEFATWSRITPLDRDGDGLRDDEEVGTDPWRYDTDGDGLSDKYELDTGTDPADPDTDSDGLMDKYELVRGTNATLQDTDGDNLTDYVEEAGWVISFEYGGEQFRVRVHSNPLVPDTDGDGVTDEMEYFSDLNPRSSDTDGDGVPDAAGPKWVELRLYSGGQWEVPAGSVGLDVDPAENVYVAALGEGVLVYQNGTLLDNWKAPGQNISVARDVVAAGEGVLVADLGNADIRGFYPNGTMDSAWGQGDDPVALAVDSDGYIHLARSGPAYAYVERYLPDGTYLGGWGSHGEPPGGLNNLTGIAADLDGGLIYLVEGGNGSGRSGRVAAFTTGGAHVEDLVGVSNPVDVDLGVNGTFVADPGNGSVMMYHPNLTLITAWAGYDDGNSSFNRPVGVAAGSDCLFVLDDLGGSSRVVRLTFREVCTRPGRLEGVDDLDGDGLEDSLEISGWQIAVDGLAGPFNRNVNSDPMLEDTDFDGLTDYLEFNISTDPRNPDTDGDGLSDWAELDWYGTEPADADTDDDGLEDGAEVTLGSDPNLWDTDGDGLSDLQEVSLGTNARNPDTDGDGLDDGDEVDAGTDPFDPDSDGDGIFDGFERDLGTDPLKTDSDGDGLSDDRELDLGTDPLDDDTDGDNLTDGYERRIRTDPLLYDTDGDTLSDSEELAMGTDPLRVDTDGDGIPDNTDMDSLQPHVRQIVLSHDPGPDNEDFVDTLSGYVNITLVSPQELLAGYSTAPYIVLVGDPASNGTTANLIEEILADAPDVLDGMEASDEDRMAIRHCIWTGTQTVVLLSRPLPGDHFLVLEALREKTVTISGGTVSMEFNRSLWIQFPTNETTISYQFLTTDEIDVVKVTDSIVMAALGEEGKPGVFMSRYGAASAPVPLARGLGLPRWEEDLGVYLSVNLTGGSGGAVEGAMINLYYTEGDLDLTGDGDSDDPRDLDENNMGIYCLNEASGRWERLDPSMDWVIDTGINTTDVMLYGKSYAGRAWAYVTHLSTFGMAGLPNNMGPQAIFDWEGDVDEGETFHVDGSGSSDADGYIVSYRWNFGDGNAADGAVADHAYADDGNYTVRLTIQDDGGSIGTATRRIEVHNRDPVVDAGEDMVTIAGDEVFLSGSFQDPGLGDTHCVEWQFGDGESASGTLDPSHIYAIPGTYTAILTVTDDDGGQGEDAIQVRVRSHREVLDELADVVYEVAEEDFRIPALASMYRQNYALAFGAIQSAIDRGDYGRAVYALNHTLRRTMDGWLEPPGEADDDWIVGREAQMELWSRIEDLVSSLEHLPGYVPQEDAMPLLSIAWGLA